MGIFNNYTNSYFSDRNHETGDFVLSGVTKEKLLRYKINMKVKDFKEMVKKSNKYKIVKTGCARYNYRRTKVYNYNNFKK